MPGPFAAFKWEALLSDWNVFAEGFGMTIAVSVLALLLALVLGIAFGMMGTEKSRLFRLVNRCYVELIQNTPLVIQIFFLYNGLPYIGIQLPIFWVGMLGIGVYHGAYAAEVVRAGILSVPKGQFEAAMAQGFSYRDTMRHIILPQAKRLAYPPLTNLAVNLIKNTSVMAMIAGGDLMYHADSWASANLYYGPAYVVTGLLYIAICFPLATYAKHLESKLEVSV
jgi:aspartate/glutamate/glutamine transport system permease protein